jgi:hypothetical protein
MLLGVVFQLVQGDVRQDPHISRIFCHGRHPLTILVVATAVWNSLGRSARAILSFTARNGATLESLETPFSSHKRILANANNEYFKFTCVYCTRLKSVKDSF